MAKTLHTHIRWDLDLSKLRLYWHDKEFDNEIDVWEIPVEVEKIPLPTSPSITMGLGRGPLVSDALLSIFFSIIGSDVAWRQ